MDRSGSGPQGQSGGRRLSLRPDLRPCPLPADSGYLFSGSRPPSQGSRAGELPVPGEETTEARGGQEAASGGSSVWAGSPEPSWGGTGGGGACGREPGVPQEFDGGQIPAPCLQLRSPGHVAATPGLSFLFCKMGV